MGRRAKYDCDLGGGREVGYAPKVRGGLFRVQFPHPTEKGKYAEAATGVPVPKGWHKGKSPPADWFEEAKKAIRAAYTPPKGAGAVGGKAFWEEAETYLLEDITRDGSERTYRSALTLVRSVLTDVKGPAEVTVGHAERFARRYASEPYRRSKSEDGALRPRSAQTVKTTLNNLSVLWVRLKKLRLVEENVWAEVERPRVPKKLPRVPAEGSMTVLLDWFDRRFPGPDGKGWELMKTFIRVKMLSGCRLNDLCQTESRQFDPKAATLLIAPDHDKTHWERLIRAVVQYAGGRSGPHPRGIRRRPGRS